MRRFLVLLAILTWAGQAAAGENAAASGCAEPPRLLSYRDAEGREHPVRSAAEWAVRRRQILRGMQEVMGRLPDRSKLPPLEMRVIKEAADDGLRRLEITFAAEPGDRVPAILLIPSSASLRGRRPAILALHQTTSIGKKEVVGLEGKPNLHYGRELAQRGYVVLAPDYPPYGDYAGYHFNADRYVSGTMKGIFNHMRAVDLLASLPEVDPERIGVIGHSLGGHNAIFVGAFDERLKVIVSSCGWTLWHHDKVSAWTADSYMPLLETKYKLDPDRIPFDFDEVVAALAPRAFFSNSPLHDTDFSPVGVREAMAEVLKVYRLLGAEGKVEVRYPDCKHNFPPEVRREAYQFIDRILNHKAESQMP